MIVASRSMLNMLMEQIVSATHSLSDHNGERIMLGTIPPERMRMAALNALQTVVGDSVWPADREIEIPERRRTGAVNVRE
jgi:hypothetical protein